MSGAAALGRAFALGRVLALAGAFAGCTPSTSGEAAHPDGDCAHAAPSDARCWAALHDASHASPAASGSAHAGADGAHDHHHMHRFDDPAFWSQRWDDPARDAWQRPTEVVGLLKLTAGMSVVDLGTGTGYFVPYLSAGVGPTGSVQALDIEAGMVRWVEERAHKSGLANVVARQVPPDDPGLAPASVDRVLIANTWHHVSGRVAYAQKLAAALRPGGEVWIVDFTKDSPEGPPPDAKLTEAEVMEELRQAGLTPATATESLPDQYAVVGRR